MGAKNFEKGGIAIGKGVSEVIEGKLYFGVVEKQEDLKAEWFPCSTICFSVDNELVYEPFFADFGPLNLACTYHFCTRLQELLKEGELHGRCVCFFCISDPKKKANAAVLLGAYLVIREDWDPEVIYTLLARFESYLPFRDPTCGVSTYHLTVPDCVRALAKAKQIGWIDFNNFNVEEYEYYEKVENGDLNWIVPNKLVALSGPGARRVEMCGYRTLLPEDYVDYFKQTGVTTLIRLNKRMYDKRKFTDHGISFHDLYFPDGSCPPQRIVQQFLGILEGSSGAVAVHCKAGLGRTGVLIGCYIMKHYRFTANEALGYLRIVRPGSVIGAQQHFLRDMQSRMWKAGDAMKRQKLDMHRNIRQNIPPSGGNSVLASNDVALVSAMATLSTRPSRFGHGKQTSQGTKLCLTNPVVTKTSSLGLNESPTAKFRMWKNVAPTNSALNTNGTRFHVNEEEWNCNSRRPVVNTSPLSARTTQMTSTRSLCMPSTARNTAATHTDPCSTSTCKKLLSFKENPCPNALHPRSSICSNASDNPGKFRNSSAYHKITSRDVCTQRTINASGQPRKVMIPISQATRDVIRNSSGRKRSNSTSRIPPSGPAR